MKSVYIFCLLILFIWFVITKLETNDDFVLLEDNVIEGINRNLVIVKTLWSVLILLQASLIFQLFRLIPKTIGMHKTGLKILLVVAIFFLIITLAVFFIGLSSFWL
jgi:hypothetical protein